MLLRIVYAILNGLNWLVNKLRRRAKIDYVLFTLPATIAPFPTPRTPLQRLLQRKKVWTMWELRRFFERLGDDPRPKGLIIVMRELSMSLADLQTLRDMLLTLRKQGKQVITYAQTYHTASYFLASAADQILLQTGGELMVTGLYQQAIFLKDTLQAAGISLDVIAISPFKSAFDQLARRDSSPEFDQQINWLLDSRYDILVNTIAEGRKIRAEDVRLMIDEGLFTDQQALQRHFVDGVLNEEQLPAHLGSQRIILAGQAARRLLIPLKQPTEDYIAILPLSGVIVEGESAQPPAPLPIPLIGGPRMGDVSVVQQIRHLIKDEHAKALILHIDSGGGSAAASEAMAAALTELGRTRPIIAYINSVAASGGYYIATPAQWIVAQSGTITGSIGVLSSKPIVNGLLDKLQANAVTYTRGANAGILSTNAPFSDEQRMKMRTMIERIYQLFVERVAASRHMSAAAVDNIGGGRVWTGMQALQHGLVDELGGLEAALRKARELADLPVHTPPIVVMGHVRPIGPQNFTDKAAFTGLLTYLSDSVYLVHHGRPALLSMVEYSTILSS